MGLLTAAAYSPTPPAGVTWNNVQATIDGQTHYGVISYPTAGQTARYGMFFRGGFTGADVKMDDTVILQVGTISGYNVAGMDPGTGYVIVMPAGRGCDAAIWTGGNATAGTDELGGADLVDWEQYWAAGRELGIDISDQYALSGKNFALCFSSGAMRCAMLMRERRINPTCVIMRSGLVNMYNWDVIPDATQNLVEGMIPGWSSGANADFADLSADDKQALWDRSPLQWAHELPMNVKYQILHAENDLVVAQDDSEAFARRLQLAGAEVDYAVVPTANHDFTPAVASQSSQLHIRGFLGRHLA